MAEFTGKTVLLTGGAGGLGTESTLLFAERGARVIVADIDEAKIAALESRAAKYGLVQIERLDLAQPEWVRTEVALLSERAGGVDVLVNNAAIYPSKPFEEYSLGEWEEVQRVNVTAAVACLQAVLPAMRRKRCGRIINIASITYYGGWARLAPYVASKGAMVALTRAWAREFGPEGITANCIAPGAFPTDAEKIHPDPEGYARFVLDHQSVKRRGVPADIATAMLFFASERAGFITGQTLNVDGGWVMQ
ncbi:MAG: SDR family NAD(P)-dependent oxidoreductase [Acetobacteraceae bacterium]